MKSLGSPFRVLDQPSLPVRGAWVEINQDAIPSVTGEVAPRAGSVG